MQDYLIGTDMQRYIKKEDVGGKYGRNVRASFHF